MHGNPVLGPSSLEQLLIGPIQASQIYSYDTFYVDEYFMNTGLAVDQGLIDACVRSRPDLILMLWWPGGPQPLNPSFEALYNIRHTLGIRIAGLWFDTWADWLVDDAEPVMDFVDFGVVTDNIDHFHGQRYERRLVEAVAPIDTVHFHDPGLERDIDVSFNGGVNNYPDRIEALSALRLAGIDVVKAGGQLESPLPLEQYARIFMRSRISLNFSYSGDKLTYKGRTFEATLCGSMLIETNNPFTLRRLRPYVDFVPFDDHADLIDKIRYYLAHEDERRCIAENGKTAVLELAHGEDSYLKTVVSQIDRFSPPSKTAALRNLIEAAVTRNDPRSAKKYLGEMENLNEGADYTSDLSERVKTVTQAGRWDEIAVTPPAFSIRKRIEVGTRLPYPPTFHCTEWLNQEAGTVIVEIQNNNDDIPENLCRLIAFSDGTYKNYIRILFDIVYKTPAVHICAEGQKQPYLPAHPFSLRRHTTTVIAVSYDDRNCALAVGGQSLTTCGISRLPRGICAMDIGRHAGEVPRIAFDVLEFAYYPIRMPESLLLAVTARPSTVGRETFAQRVVDSCQRLMAE